MASVPEPTEPAEATEPAEPQQPPPPQEPTPVAEPPAQATAAPPKPKRKPRKQKPEDPQEPPVPEPKRLNNRAATPPGILVDQTFWSGLAATHRAMKREEKSRRYSNFAIV